MLHPNFIYNSLISSLTEPDELLEEDEDDELMGDEFPSDMMDDDESEEGGDKGAVQ